MSRHVAADLKLLDRQPGLQFTSADDRPRLDERIAMTTARDHRSMPSARPIRFDRTKYGRCLLADAGEVRTDFPDLITGPEPHRLTFHEIALVTHGRGTLDVKAQ